MIFEVNSKYYLDPNIDCLMFGHLARRGIEVQFNLFK
jgi:hypothetical protein